MLDPEMEWNFMMSLIFIILFLLTKQFIYIPQFKVDFDKKIIKIKNDVFNNQYKIYEKIEGGNS